MSGKHYVGMDLTSFRDNGVTKPISRVTLNVDDETVITAGDDTGLEITADCPHGTQTMADAILKRLKGYKYQMYTADAVNIDPAAELGDGITVGGVYGVLSRLSDDGDGYPDASGPGEAELEDEYPTGEGPLTKAFNRKIAQTRSFITKTASEIRLEVQNEVEGLSTSFTVQLGNVKTELQDSIKGLSASVDLKLDGLSAEFSSELSGLSAEFSAGLSGLTARVEEVATDAQQDLADYADTVTKSLGELQKQVDGQIETHFYGYEPTLSNAPANSWAGDTEKTKHEGDLFYDTTTGYAYRFFKDGGTWKWQMIQDTDITKALSAAATAQDTADNKRRVFTSQPVPPYDVGDLWTQGSKGDLMRCNTKRESGGFVQGDWGLASKYTDDTYAEEKYAELNITIDSINSTVSGLGGRVTTVEQTASGLTTSVQGLDGKYTTLQQTVNGFTFTDESGKVWINNGNINLTGAITWGDLESSVQSSINNRGISSSQAKQIAHTTITEDLVESPTIRGANIYGGTFWDAEGTAKLTLSYEVYQDRRTPYLNLTKADGYRVFGAYAGDFGVAISGYNGNVAMIIESTATHPKGIWNFTTATVTGLKFA